MATQVKILDEAICISNSTNTNTATSLGEWKLWSQTFLDSSQNRPCIAFCWCGGVGKCIQLYRHSYNFKEFTFCFIKEIKFLYGCYCSLASLPGPLWPRTVAPDQVISMGQIEVFDLQTVLKLNWIVWNRTALIFKLCTYVKMNFGKLNCFLT